MVRMMRLNRPSAEVNRASNLGVIIYLGHRKGFLYVNDRHELDGVGAGFV